MSYYLRKWKTPAGEERKAWAVHVVENDPSGKSVEVRQNAPKNAREKEAKDYEHKVRLAIREGNWCEPCDDFKPACKCAVAPVAKVMTVAEFVEVWQARNRRECAHGTVLFYDECLKVILPQFGALPVGAVEFDHIEAFKAHLHTLDLAPASMNNVLRGLRAMLGYAAEAGKFGKGVRAPVVRLLPKTPQKGKYLSVAQAASLHTWVKANAPEWAAMILVMLRTGLRMGEIIALKWSAVDLKGALVHVRETYYRGQFAEISHEDAARRAVPLSDDALAALQEHGRVRRLDNPFVFPGTLKPHMTEASPRRVFERASEFLKGLGIEAASDHRGVEPYTRADNLSPHVLRHSFATHAVSQGKDIYALGKLMGHADVSTTQVYAKVTDEALREVVADLGKGSGT